MSVIETFKYTLAKFLVPFLKPLTDNQYTIHSSFLFPDEITQLTLSHGAVVVSFDVASLFTNTPLDETVNNISGEARMKKLVLPLWNERKNMRGLKNFLNHALLKHSMESTHFQIVKVYIYGTMTTSDLEKTEKINDYFAKIRKDLAANVNSREAIPEHYYRVIPYKNLISLRVGPA